MIFAKIVTFSNLGNYHLGQCNGHVMMSFNSLSIKIFWEACHTIVTLIERNAELIITLLLSMQMHNTKIRSCRSFLYFLSLNQTRSRLTRYRCFRISFVKFSASYQFGSVKCFSLVSTVWSVIYGECSNEKFCEGVGTFHLRFVLSYQIFIFILSNLVRDQIRV